MSGGEPSSIKRKPSCAAELPILSPNRGKAVGRALSNCSRAVLWGAERISLETTLSSERMHRAWLGYIRPGQKFRQAKLLLRLV